MYCIALSLTVVSQIQSNHRQFYPTSRRLMWVCFVFGCYELVRPSSWLVTCACTRQFSNHCQVLKLVLAFFRSFKISVILLPQTSTFFFNTSPPWLPLDIPCLVHFAAINLYPITGRIPVPRRRFVTFCKIAQYINSLTYLLYCASPFSV